MMDKTLVISWLHFLDVFIVHTFFFNYVFYQGMVLRFTSDQYA